MVGGDGIQTVVMGHTHQPRVVGAGAIPSYINTGTWTDTVLVPPHALVDGDEALTALEEFLVRLCRADPRSHVFTPSFAEIELNDGVVTAARLDQAA